MRRGVLAWPRILSKVDEVGPKSGAFGSGGQIVTKIALEKRDFRCETLAAGRQERDGVESVRGGNSFKPRLSADLGGDHLAPPITASCESTTRPLIVARNS